MTFAQEGEEHESPINNKIKIEDDPQPLISSENEFRITKPKKDYANENREISEQQITDRSQKEDNTTTTFNLETYL